MARETDTETPLEEGGVGIFPEGGLFLIEKLSSDSGLSTSAFISPSSGELDIFDIYAFKKYEEGVVQEEIRPPGPLGGGKEEETGAPTVAEDGWSLRRLDGAPFPSLQSGEMTVAEDIDKTEEETETEVYPYGSSSGVSVTSSGMIKHTQSEELSIIEKFGGDEPDFSQIIQATYDIKASSYSVTYSIKKNAFIRSKTPSKLTEINFTSM